MGAKVSAEMTKARRLIETEGMSVSAAAAAASVSKQAIYMSQWYKDWKHAQQTRNCAPKR